MSSILSHIKVSKILISFVITLSTMLGYLIFSPYIDKVFWITAISSFFLCSGSGALNNYQDRHIDKLLKRTSKRPLPSGSISEIEVLVQAILLICLGLTGFSFTKNALISTLLALIGVICYNGIYTPLKFRTILAIFPGSICGMIPPLMGWYAAGAGVGFSITGDSTNNTVTHFFITALFNFGSNINSLNINSGSDRSIFWVMAVIGVWQLPHFWLVVLKHADDYRQSYKKYMLNSMLTLFDILQLRRIVLIWTLLYSSMLIMTPMFYGHLSKLTKWIVVFNGSTLFIVFIVLYFLTSFSVRLSALKKNAGITPIIIKKSLLDSLEHCVENHKLEFIMLNSSMLFFIIILICDRLINT
ncbi:MAG: UbiA family prenyltransferase [Desulfamplus sp.]|nr:UbiA family prenyltransferase [Desulfamplus sp.]